MPEDRQGRLRELAAAYEGYYVHLQTIAGESKVPSKLGFVMQNGDAIAQLALKLAVHEVFGKK